MIGTLSLILSSSHKSLRSRSISSLRFPRTGATAPFRPDTGLASPSLRNLSHMLHVSSRRSLFKALQVEVVYVLPVSSMIQKGLPATSLTISWDLCGKAWRFLFSCGMKESPKPSERKKVRRRRGHPGCSEVPWVLGSRSGIGRSERVVKMNLELLGTWLKVVLLSHSSAGTGAEAFGSWATTGECLWSGRYPWPSARPLGSGKFLSESLVSRLPPGQLLHRPPWYMPVGSPTRRTRRCWNIGRSPRPRVLSHA